MTRRPLFWGATILLAALSALACIVSRHFDPPPPILVTTNSWVGYEPIRLARSRGRLPTEVAKLVEFTSSYDSIRALRSRSVNAAALTLDEALTVVSSDKEYRVVMVVDVSNGGDAIIARAPFKSLRELKGRRIAVDGGAVGAYTLTRALTLAGMQPSEIIPVQIPASQQGKMWKNGEVDALVTFEPYRSQLVADGGIEVFSSREIPGEIVDVLLVHKSVIESNRKNLVALISAWHDSIEHIRSHPDEAYAAMAASMGMSPQALRATFANIALTDRKASHDMLASGQLRKTAERLNAVMVKEKLIPKPAELDDLFDASAAKEVAP